MILVWLVLGALIDSISIILLTVPVFGPLASALGFDPIAFAIIGILAIETGLLTPPLGILVFTVKPAVKDEPDLKRSAEHPSELQSLMRIQYAVFCSNKHNHYRQL